MSQDHKFILLDTNIYLHYDFFTDIPWTTVVEASEATLVVPLVTLREIEKHKYSQTSKKVRERADKVARRLVRLHDSGEPLRPGVQVLFDSRQPREEFDTHNLNRESQDDHLLAFIIHFQKEDAGRHVLLITNDLPMKMIASEREIKTLRLPDRYGPVFEVDPNEKRIRELEQQLREHQLRVPQLKLHFDNGSERVEFVLQRSPYADPQFIAKRMEQFRERHPKMDLSPADSTADRPKRAGGTLDMADLLREQDAGVLGMLGDPHLRRQPLRRDVERYNEELETFYQKYERYLFERAKVEKLLSRIVSIDVQLDNREGSAPAEDVRIDLVFPGGLQVTHQESLFELPESPEPPEEPKPPKSQMEMLMDMGRLVGREPYISPATIAAALSTHREPPRVIWRGLKEEDDRFVASFEVRRLNPGLVEHCPRTLYVTFDSLETGHSFKIEYQITAANVPKRQSGFLHVVAKTKDGEGIS